MCWSMAKCCWKAGSILAPCPARCSGVPCTTPAIRGRSTPSPARRGGKNQDTARHLEKSGAGQIVIQVCYVQPHDHRCHTVLPHVHGVSTGHVGQAGDGFVLRHTPVKGALDVLFPLRDERPLLI